MSAPAARRIQNEARNAIEDTFTKMKEAASSQNNNETQKLDFQTTGSVEKFVSSENTTKKEAALKKSKHPRHPMLALQEMCMKQRLPQPKYEFAWDNDKERVSA